MKPYTEIRTFEGHTASQFILLVKTFRAQLFGQYWIPKYSKQCLPIKEANNWKWRDEYLQMVIKQSSFCCNPAITLATQILGKWGSTYISTTYPSLLTSSIFLLSQPTFLRNPVKFNKKEENGPIGIPFIHAFNGCRGLIHFCKY